MSNHTKLLYIASHEPNAGSLIVTMGIMELLKSRLHRVAFFRPIIEKRVDEDNDIHFMLKHFEIDQSYKESYAFSVQEAEELIINKQENRLLEVIISKVKKLESTYDFVLIEGLNRESFNTAIEFNINLFIAKNLQVPYVSVINGQDKSYDDVLHALQLESVLMKQESLESVAMYANRLDETVYAKLKQSLTCKEQEPYFFMPEIPELDAPTVGEVMHALGCRLLQGETKDLDRIIRQSKIAAMNIENMLTHVQENELIIVPGDRVDVILSALSANYSKDFPTIAGIVLSGGLRPSDTFMKLLRGLPFNSIPILSIDTDTFTSTMLINEVKARLRPNRDRKIALALGSFMQNTNVDIVNKRIDSSHSNIMTPKMFEYLMFERASREIKRIVLPESSDERVLRAVEILLRRDVVEIILLGVEEDIRYNAMTLGLDITKARIINPLTCKELEAYTQHFYSMRKHKGLSINAARDAIVHSTYFATMMVELGDADGMVSGAIHTTQDTIRPALQIIKTTPDISLVSSLFLMCMQTKVLVYADCAINQEPSAQELAQIAIVSAQSARLFGIVPRIAMLSYSTGDSGKGDEVEKVREATAIVKKLRPDLLVEGPIQYDAAIDKRVALKKLPDSKVAGEATVFIFPDLNTGNNTYKAVQRSSGAIAIGPVLQGLKKPVNDLSRGCEIADIVNTVLITAIQAQEI